MLNVNNGRRVDVSGQNSSRRRVCECDNGGMQSGRRACGRAFLAADFCNGVPVFGFWVLLLRCCSILPGSLGRWQPLTNQRSVLWPQGLVSMATGLSWVFQTWCSWFCVILSGQNCPAMLRERYAALLHSTQHALRSLCSGSCSAGGDSPDRHLHHRSPRRTLPPPRRTVLLVPAQPWRPTRQLGFPASCTLPVSHLHIHPCLQLKAARRVVTDRCITPLTTANHLPLSKPPGPSISPFPMPASPRSRFRPSESTRSSPR